MLQYPDKSLVITIHFQNIYLHIKMRDFQAKKKKKKKKKLKRQIS